MTTTSVPYNGNGLTSLDTSAGADFQNDSGNMMSIWASVTVGPTAVLAATATLEVRASGSTVWTEIGRAAVPAGGVALAGSIHQLTARVLPGWGWRLTLTNATVLTYYASSQ